MVDAELHPLVPHHPSTRAAITFDGNEGTLVKKANNSKAEVASTSAFLSSCDGATLYVDGEKNNKLKAQDANLRVNFETVKIDQLLVTRDHNAEANSLFSSPKEQPHFIFTIQSQGVSDSITQDANEILPTV
jgi:hypothetical protein